MPRASLDGVVRGILDQDLKVDKPDIDGSPEIQEAGVHDRVTMSIASTTALCYEMLTVFPSIGA